MRTRPLRALAILVCALAPLPAAAGSDAALDLAAARHLLTRAGFAPTASEARALEGRTREDAVDALLAGTRTTPVTPPPAWVGEHDPAEPGLRPAQLTDAERKSLRQRESARIAELRAWWLDEMRATPSPLTERMTLFWHNHFVSSEQKVRDARLMYAQNAALRREALGSFSALVHTVAKDPAMLIYLDGARNRRGAPNENFAREVMELFTLGEGHYRQSDVSEAARAFTGIGVDRQAGEAVFRPRLHDSGIKEVLGTRGNLDTDTVLDVLLAQPETASFIVAKLWREFVSPAPDSREVERIAADFRASGYSIKVALRELLLCDAFWAAESRGTLVKSPAELVVGTLRAVAIAPRDMRPFAAATSRMGQTLFAPPNVKGWPGGDAWINSSTLLARQRFLAALSRRTPEGAAMQIAASAGHRIAIDDLLLPLPPVGDAVAEARAEREPAGLVRAAFLDPVYQLK
jgi:uncharacterized protein (DUF1800 family)